MPPRERQKLQPRAPEYFKGPAPYNPGREPEYFKGPAPYNPGREPIQPFPLRQDNSGVMAAMADNPMVQQAKGLYQKFDPWIPNLDGNSLGYEWQRPLLGGTLGYGMDYDWDNEDIGAFINWQLKMGS